MSSGSSASKLSQLAGLAGAKRVLEGLFARESGVHAVLLYGAEGSGKSTIATILSQFWLCQNPSAEGACGECQACAAFERGMSSDFLLVEPQPPSFIIRGPSVTRSKQPRPDDPPLPIDEFLRTQPLAGRHKVVLIESADRMNGTAANALLKNLEEPQEYGKLILTTSELSKMMPTIVSRCVSVACELPSENEWASTGVDPELLKLFGGSPGAYQKNADREQTYRKIKDFAGRLASRPQAEALAASEEFSAICDEFEKPGETNARAANTEGLKMLAQYLSEAGKYRPEQINEVVEAHRRIMGNAHAGITFDAMFASMLML